MRSFGTNDLFTGLLLSGHRRMQRELGPVCSRRGSARGWAGTCHVRGLQRGRAPLESGGVHHRGKRSVLGHGEQRTHQGSCGDAVAVRCVRGFDPQRAVMRFTSNQGAVRVEPGSDRHRTMCDPHGGMVRSTPHHVPLCLGLHRIDCVSWCSVLGPDCDRHRGISRCRGDMIPCACDPVPLLLGRH
jgi:hypothetical protein